MDDEKDNSENETDQEDSREIQNDPWHKKAITEGPSSTQSLCHLMPPTQGHERSGCETPVSVDSIPLEWDHTGDVGGSSSHEDDEEATYYSALSGENPCPAVWFDMDSWRMCLCGKGGELNSCSHIVGWFSSTINRCEQTHLLDVLMKEMVLSKPSFYFQKHKVLEALLFKNV